MRTKTIKVTQADIDNGCMRNGVYCPIALAAKRAFRTQHVTVHSVIHVISGNNTSAKTWILPQEAIEFIFNFDHMVTVEPFEFEAREKA
jgi:hypothetical protein